MSVATDRKTTDAVYLHPEDNICVAARNLNAGESLELGGAKITLHKPVRLEALTGTLRKWLPCRAELAVAASAGALERWMESLPEQEAQS